VSRVGGRGGDSFLSPDLQREQIAAVAARENLEVVEVIEELDARPSTAPDSAATVGSSNAPSPGSTAAAS
jgi:hypothetical protein